MQVARPNNVFLILAAALFATAWIFYPSSSFYNSHIFILPKTLSLAVACFLFGLVYFRSQMSFTLKPADLLIFLFIMTALFSSLVNLAPLSTVILWLAETFSLGAIYLMARNLARSTENSEYFARLVVMSTLVVAIATILEAIWPNIIWAMASKPGSLAGNRNSMGTYCGVGSIVSMALYLKRNEKLYISTFSLCLIAVTLSRTRAVWLSLAVTFLAFLLFMGLLIACRKIDFKKYRHTALRLVVVFVLSLVFATQIDWPQLRWKDSNPYQKSLSQIFDHQSGTGRDRILQHHLGRALWQEHKVLGSGIGGWRREAPKYENIIQEYFGTYIDTGMLSSPASDPLRILSEFGLLGSTIILFFFLSLFSNSLRKQYNQPNALTFAIILALFFLCLDSFFDKPLVRAMTALPFAAFAGILSDAQGGILEIKARPVLKALVMGAATFSLATISLQCYSRFELLREPNLSSLERSLNIFPDPFFAALIIRESTGNPDCSRILPVAEKIQTLLPNETAVHSILARCKNP